MLCCAVTRCSCRLLPSTIFTCIYQLERKFSGKPLFVGTLQLLQTPPVLPVPDFQYVGFIVGPFEDAPVKPDTALFFDFGVHRGSR